MSALGLAQKDQISWMSTVSITKNRHFSSSLALRKLTRHHILNTMLSVKCLTLLYEIAPEIIKPNKSTVISC